MDFNPIFYLPPFFILAAKIREGTRRKNGYEFDSRGLIHQTHGRIADARAALLAYRSGPPAHRSGLLFSPAMKIGE
jgi:hypothetical protein